MALPTRNNQHITVYVRKGEKKPTHDLHQVGNQKKKRKNPYTKNADIFKCIAYDSDFICEEINNALLEMVYQHCVYFVARVCCVYRARS